MRQSAYIFAPPGYWALSPERKRSLCNGCGAKRFGGWLVPDTLYGLSVEEACNVHDFMYSVGVTIEDKESADRTFLNNMLRTIAANSLDGFVAGTLAALRRRRALKYYEAVHLFGGPAFWASKNPPGSVREVTA